MKKNIKMILLFLLIIIVSVFLFIIYILFIYEDKRFKTAIPEQFNNNFYKIKK